MSAGIIVLVTYVHVHCIGVHLPIDCSPTKEAENWNYMYHYLAKVRNDRTYISSWSVELG